jgi:RNA polymerase sigma-70 factor (ECF subfamily)
LTLTLRLRDARHDSVALIEAAKDGEPAAREWLVAHYTQVAFRFAVRMLGNEQDARDAAHDTMIKVLRNLSRYNDNYKFSTWVLSITRNTCIDEFRRRKRRPVGSEVEAVDGAPRPDEVTERHRRARKLHEALDTLPQMYREILVLYHFEHLKYQEIADLLDTPIGTVMNRIFRARRKLRTAYEIDEAPVEAQ